MSTYNKYKPKMRLLDIRPVTQKDLDLYDEWGIFLDGESGDEKETG